MQFQKITAILLLGSFSTPGAAEFQNSFKNVTHGSDLLLRWEPVEDIDYPLVIHAKLLNRTSKYGANSIEMDISAEVDGTSFHWQTVPHPLPYLQTATYEIEIRLARPLEVEGDVPALVLSPYFMISGAEDEGSDESTPFNGNITMPAEPIDESHSSSGINNNAAIAAGLIIPVAVAIAVIGFLWIQRRQKRSLAEKRKHRETLFIE